MNVESDVPVRECMSTPVETVATETSLVEAAQTMRNASISALVVMSEPRSIVTSTDFVDAVAKERDVTSLSTADISTAVVTTVEPDLPLTQAAATMTRHDSSHLPVAEAGELVGMLSKTDLARYQAD
jgi:CBS domain-containing protein